MAIPEGKYNVRGKTYEGVNGSLIIKLNDGSYQRVLTETDALLQSGGLLPFGGHVTDGPRVQLAGNTFGYSYTLKLIQYVGTPGDQRAGDVQFQDEDGNVLATIAADAPFLSGSFNFPTGSPIYAYSVSQNDDVWFMIWVSAS